MRYYLEAAKCFGLLALLFLTVIMLAVGVGAITGEDDTAGASSALLVVKPSPSARVAEPIAKAN